MPSPTFSCITRQVDHNQAQIEPGRVHCCIAFSMREVLLHGLIRYFSIIVFMSNGEMNEMEKDQTTLLSWKNVL